MRPVALACLLVVVLSQACLAGDDIRPTRIEVVPNFNAASVYAYFEGDDNGNATARMEYRAGDAKDFRPGHVLARTGKGRFAASLFGLRPGEALEVRVTFEDPEVPPNTAGFQPILVARTQTRSDVFPAGTGKTLCVAPGGDDANPGTAEKPLKTVQHAADVAAPGDVIALADGAYFESVMIKRSGRPDAYITLRAAADAAAGPKSAAPAGASAPRPPRPVLRGWAPPQGEWQTQEGNLYTIDEKRTVGTVTIGGEPGGALPARVYHHTSLEELKSAEPPLVPGWWQDAKAGKFYLRLAAGQKPADAGVRLGVLPLGLRFENAGYWIVEGLEFECFGGGLYSRGIDIVGSRNIVVRHCRFDTMRTGIAVRKAGAVDCLIERNDFRESGIWGWPWKECKSHDVEGSAIDLAGGGGNVARFNTIRGFFNGIGASTWGDLENEALNRDLDIHDNTFTEIGDDPLEPEGACMNMRFWNNRTRDTLQGISLAPITVGPVYVVRDQYVNYKQSAVKAGVDSRGVVYLYHILGWTNRADGNALEPCGNWDQMHFRNSILRGTRYVIEDSRSHKAGCTFDYVDFFTTGTQPFLKWEGQRYPRLEDLPAKAGFGPHILRVEPYAKIEAGGPAGPLAPQLIDAGVVIPGINDDFKGKAPDIGPEEVR